MVIIFTKLTIFIVINRDIVNFAKQKKQFTIRIIPLCKHLERTFGFALFHTSPHLFGAPLPHAHEVNPMRKKPSGTHGTEGNTLRCIVIRPERSIFAHLKVDIKMKTASRQSGTNSRAANPINNTAFGILLIISISHLLNDMIQSVIPAVYPILKEKFGFTFTQIGLITLVFQMTSSILQPFTGLYADRNPKPYSLSTGMCFTLCGLLLLSMSDTLALILLSVGLVGLGSSVFHPEASRAAQLASGGRKSLAQSIFQVGGNGGNAIGPLLAAAIVLPHGQGAISWFALAAIAAALLLLVVGKWYSRKLAETRGTRSSTIRERPLPAHLIRRALVILVILLFSKYFFAASMTSYFTFFLMDKFALGVKHAQLCLFAYLAAFAAGTVIGGALGDRFGRKRIILISILGAAPFALAMPYLSLGWTIVMAVITGFIIASAFPSIIVYATELLPDRVGMISGVFFGLMFGIGGLGSAFFGWLADRTSIEFIFRISSLLPLIGIIALWLPDLKYCSH